MAGFQGTPVDWSEISGVDSGGGFQGTPVDWGDLSGGSDRVEDRQKERISSLPEVTSGLGADVNLIQSMALLTTTDPEEFSEIVTKADPNITKVYPGPGEPPILFNKKANRAFQINKEGFSPIDALQGLGIASAFFPTAKITGLGFGQLGKQAVASGATQTGIEALQAVTGGSADIEDVGLAAGFGAAAQYGGEKILSPLARAVGGRVDQGMKSLIQQAKDKGLDLMTSDLVPPNTFFGKNMQSLGEKIPFVGTGWRRARQQSIRSEIVEGLAQEMGLSLDTPVEKGIISSLSKGVADKLKAAGEIRQQAVESLDQYGSVPVNKTIQSIDNQIAKQQRLRLDADPTIIKRLEDLKQSIQDADFSLVKDLRSNLIDDISAAFKGESLPTKAAAPLQSVKKAIDDDLLSFARSKDRDAASKWVRSNRMFADGYQKAKNTELKKMLIKGDATPEIVGDVLRSARPSELKRLNSFLDSSGRKHVKMAVIRDALTESKFFTDGANPDRFVTAMNKPARQRVINQFFSDADRNEIKGLVRMLDATNRAQKAELLTPTGQQMLLPVIGGSAYAAPDVTLATAGTLSLMANAYEGAGVRNLLLRMANAPRGSDAEQNILKKLLPLFSAPAQSYRAQLETEQ